MAPVAEFYKAVRNSIVDSTGKQIAVVLPSNCTMKLAREMAAYAAQQANHDAQRKARATGVAVPAAPKLGVWFGAMPESNGKANWTAILHRGDLASGHTIERSEHHDRVRYEADRVRWLIGELAEEPDLLAYDPDMLNPPDYEHPCGVKESR